MNKNIIIFLFLTLFMLTCTKNDQLKIIEGVVLGQSKDQYFSQIKELKIPNKDFYTNFLMLREEDLDKKINFYYTELFNYDEFKNSSGMIHHYGLFVPEFINNNNLTSLKILLGHTGTVAFGNPEMNKEDNAIYFRQDVINDVLNKIIELYTLKYGKPEKEIKLFGPLEGDYLYESNLEKISFDSNEERSYIWETEYYTISLFYGFNLNAFYENGFYSTSTNRLFSNLSKDPLTQRQKHCLSLSYIKYTLNEKGLKKIGLDKMNY